MPKNSQSIPINSLIAGFDTDIFIGKIISEDLHLYEKLEGFDSLKQSHRDEYQLFIIQERGTMDIEIDFQRYTLPPSSVLFIQQNQVHRIISFESVTATILAIRNENIKPEYLNLFTDITPTKPLELTHESFLMISEATSFCLKILDGKNEKLYHTLLNGSCNTLIGLIISQYLIQSKISNKLSRFEIITKAFKKLLEQNFNTIKRPKEYANQLNISTNYLNECVKKTTGHSVTYHIQQRIILEAKRLLFHSELSVKEIATELGYNDYPYFSRLFSKVTGMTALTFRNKNID